jgi:hypothetical protein
MNPLMQRGDGRCGDLGLLVVLLLLLLSGAWARAPESCEGLPGMFINHLMMQCALLMCSSSQVLMCITTCMSSISLQVSLLQSPLPLATPCLIFCVKSM